jgi:adenine/guanine phosphoribosyltransferase-like PRPP-binding protein
MITKPKLTKEKINDILDDILDKISKYGIKSITTIHEKGFLLILQ